MFLSRADKPAVQLRIAVCYADSAMTRAAADALVRLEACDPIAVLSDTPKDILWLCQREKPDLLLLEAVPDTMERFDDPDKDITGRCETAARVREELPDCRVYLICGEEFRRLEPVMRKAVETKLIDGYCFGALTKQRIEAWLADKSRSFPPFRHTKWRKPL